MICLRCTRPNPTIRHGDRVVMIVKWDDPEDRRRAVGEIVETGFTGEIYHAECVPDLERP